MFDVKETVPELVLISVFAEVVIVTPISATSEYSMLIPSSSINLSVMIIFISLPIVCVV